jgi:PAS domain S-box-containing protein
MRDTPSPTVDRLANYERNYSPEGLLKRYARGRVRHFSGRQIMTLTGGVVVGATNGFEIGLLAIGLALLGEALDCFCLLWILKKLEAGHSCKWARAVSTLTAFFQACTISACVFLAWFGSESGVTPLFATAFLAGAAINAGLVMPFHKPAAVVRLMIYALTTVGLHVVDLYGPETVLSEWLLNAVGTVLLGYMVALFLQFVGWGFRDNRDTARALTQQSRALIRHQKEAHQLSLVARNAHDSVIISNGDGTIAWINEAFTRITGYTLSEAQGHSPGELLNGPLTDPATIEAIQSAIQNGQPFRGEIQNVTKAGADIWVETNLVPILDDAGNVEMSVAVERDVTEAKNYARELKAARDAAEDGARAKAEFLATMSHEIRTPMNGVVGMTDLLLETDLGRDQRVYADTIKSSAKALLTIINDVLDLSKLDAHQMALDPVEFDLRQCCEDTVRLMRPEANSKGLTLTFNPIQSIPNKVKGDDGRLRQVLLNLIGNAIKFTHEGEVIVTLSADRWENGYILTLVVEDTGIGIAEEQLDHVFDRFSQADAATTRHYGGTGLGLTISLELIRMMGGEIGVDSVLGEGSRFTVTLPMDHVPDDQPEWRENLTKLGSTNLCALKGMKILVAEDNKINRLVIKKFLADLPVNLQFSYDGQQAVKLASEFRPDLIFMDMSMPVMGGLEATRVIRETPMNQPIIIALTANTFGSDKTACRQAGMNDFMSKPLRRADLISRLLVHAPKRAGCAKQ